jgi:hypothetical protein
MYRLIYIKLKTTLHEKNIEEKLKEGTDKLKNTLNKIKSEIEKISKKPSFPDSGKH